MDVEAGIQSWQFIRPGKKGWGDKQEGGPGMGGFRDCFGDC